MGGGGGRVEAGGTVIEFPMSETAPYTWPPRLPTRLRRRLLVHRNKTPCTVEDIEAKLRLADLRRQVFFFFFFDFLFPFCLVFVEFVFRRNSKTLLFLFSFLKKKICLLCYVGI